MFVFIPSLAWSLVTLRWCTHISVNVVLTDCYHDQPLLSHLIFSVANTLPAPRVKPFPNILSPDHSLLALYQCLVVLIK